MTIDIEVHGRRRAVTVTRTGAAWVVHLDGRAILVDAVSLDEVADVDGRMTAMTGMTGSGFGARGRSVPGAMARGGRPRIPERWSLLTDDAPVDAARPLHAWTSHDVALEDRGDVVVVHVRGAAIPVAVIDPRRGVRAGADPIDPAGGPVHVTAPMPGRVVKVLVTAGEHVRARQGLIIVEAMKMENELRAPCAGLVRDVHAGEGALVDAGVRLVTIDPAAAARA